MNAKRISLFALVVTALLTVSACGNESTAPERAVGTPATLASRGTFASPALAATVGNAISAQSWLTPLAAPITVSARVSNTQAGVLSIPSLGISVTIPAGATDTSMTISMTAMAGGVVALDFQPSGTKFKLPLHVTQNLVLTKWSGAPFSVVYFKNQDDVNSTTKSITWTELIPVKLTGVMAAFDIWHFSGYALAAG